MSKVKFTVNGKELIAEEGSNVLEAARINGFNIPSLCHDPRLEPFGACRQCLIEVDGWRGAVQACGAKVQAGMVIRTNTENIIGLRRLGLELLLTEHCGDCIAPCQLACPAKIDIQGFVAHIANGQVSEAAKLVREKLPLPASIGRVCPRFCETDCRRNLIDGPVSICFLKRYVGDLEMMNGGIYTPPIKPDTGKQVAVVGGGPAGLAAAYYLALEGHRVTIFEAAPQLGGMMKYGIPEYRLPKAELDKEIKAITDLCQDVFCNKAMGCDFTIKKLRQMGFDAIFVGIGSWANQSLNLPGEDLAGVYSGIHFLGEIALNKPITLGNKVVVIGGGNTAMDAARTLVRLGAPEVTVVYRRSREEMPASPHEVTQADEEGVKFELLTAPVAFVGKEGKVRVIKCVKMKLGEPDKSGRRRPVPIEGSEFEIPVDMVITATGQKLEQSSVAGSPELALNKWNDIDANSATMQTGVEWLFTGGDCVTGPATAVEALAAGRKAAVSMIQYLKGEAVVAKEDAFNCNRGKLDEIDPTEFADRERIPRTAMPTVAPEVRKGNFKEFELGFTAEMAKRETDRCLSCGCMDAFTCRLREYATDVQVRSDRLGFGEIRYAIQDDHPNIVRDPNKCVLCGNCVRVCQDIQGVGALGFVNRGSQTVVLPSLKSPLSDTLCKSCGQCVAVCPTGALTRRSIMAKPGPWQTEKVDSVCPHCNIGCKLELNMVGDQIVGVTSPIIGNTVNEGDLCAKGTFGYAYTQNPKRLRTPMVRKNVQLEEVSWEEDISKAGNILKGIRDSASLESVAVAVSSRMTNEENFFAYKLDRMGLGTNNIFGTVPVSISKTALEAKSKDEDISFKDIVGSDLIIIIDGEISDNYPIVAHKIKKAVAQGSKLLIVSPEATSLHPLAKYTLKISHKNTLRLMETFASYVLQYNLIDAQIARENPSLIEDLKNQITQDFYDTVGSFQVKPEKIIEFLHYYLRAKNPVIVVDGHTIAPDELELLSKFALITGNLIGPGRGMITLYPHGNMQGQIDMGIKADVRDHRNNIEGMKNDKIKGLLILGDGSPLDAQLFQNGAKTIAIITSPITCDTVNEGDLCAKGTFDYAYTQNPKRLYTPMVRKNGQLEEASWEEAISKAGNILKGIRDSAGLDSVAVAVSPRMTNEENFFAYKLGRMGLGTNNIFGTVPVSISETALEAKRKDEGTSFKDMVNSDLIIVINGEISDNYPIVAHKIKKAVAKGSKLLIVSPEVTSLHPLAKYTLKISHKNTLRLMETFASYVLQYNLIDAQVARENPSLIEDLKNQITEDFYDTIGSFLVKPEKIIEFLHYYLRAKNPVIVVDGHTIAPDELELLSKFALITGNLVGPGRGMITLYPHGNMQGQIDMGIKVDVRNHRNIIEGMKNGKIKGLLILGDGSPLDPQLFQNGVKTIAINSFMLNGHEFDVVFPGATFAETNGSYTNCEGRIQRLTSAFSPWGGKENWQILVDLAAAVGYQMDCPNEAKAHSEVLNQLLRRLNP